MFVVVLLFDPVIVRESIFRFVACCSEDGRLSAALVLTVVFAYMLFSMSSKGRRRCGNPNIPSVSVLGVVVAGRLLTAAVVTKTTLCLSLELDVYWG